MSSTVFSMVDERQPFSTGGSAIAEGPRDALFSMEVLQQRNIPFKKACNQRITLT